MKKHYDHKELYKALINRDTQYEGIFFVGVKSTNIFCKPTCTARKPKFDNCEFYYSFKEAMLAGYRACKICRPHLLNSEDSNFNLLLIEIENNPQKKWRERDIKIFGLDPSTARRIFKKKFGVTFIEYTRMRRLGLAFKEIKNGTAIIESQINAGYESSSGFRDAFNKIMGSLPSNVLGVENKNLTSIIFDTILGQMIAIASDNELYLLEFCDRRGLENEIRKLRIKYNYNILPGINKILDKTKNDIKQYFEGKICNFDIDIKFLGSEFQKNVWTNLCSIPYGTTISYSILANKIGNSRAYRAVANANGANQIALIVPCHRVIKENNQIGGYGGGIARKKWLIEHEQKFKINKHI